MKYLELLAPARTAEIGIAAIDCGADAVYIAGPAFGARQAAGNSVEDIARLCTHAHKFGARIFVTVNTLVYENELDQVQTLVRELEAAGADALIVQDPAILGMSSRMVMHASTQCAIRTPERARFLESLGFGRLVLERQLSLEEIREIASSVKAEIEFFVHGALCVCYSGQCYLSEYLSGRSANRGACIQACRSLYDLEDASGRTLLKNKALLSLKDYNLFNRLEELALSGVSSFKIEGRLKNESYVRNVTTAYSEALNALVEKHPDQFRRSSFGKVRNAPQALLDSTFNRGYTELFLDGKKGNWASLDAPKSMGEYVGTVKRLTPSGLDLNPASKGISLNNGDGFPFVGPSNQIVGFRADVAEGCSIHCKAIEGLRPGTPLYRNINAAFEKKLSASRPERLIGVELAVKLENDRLLVEALSQDGRKVSQSVETPPDEARDPERMLQTLLSQLEKTSGHYSFHVGSLSAGSTLPFMTAAFLNGIRRSLAQELDALPVNALPLYKGEKDASVGCAPSLSYKENIANSQSRSLYIQRGALEAEPAYELTHREGAELMRSKYCVRHELGLCPRQNKSNKAEPLFLRNGKKRLRLDFHCDVCEMTVS